MSAWAFTRTFVRAAGSSLRHAPFVHAVAVLTLALALFSLGLARAGARLLDGLTQALGGEVEVTAYLDPAAGPAAHESARALAEAQGGGTARLVPPEEALRRLAAGLGELGTTLEDLPENPLPPSLEVKVAPARRTPEALRALKAALLARPGVTAVDYGEAAVARLEAISHALERGGLFAFALVLLVASVVVSATLQLAIYARRDEIEIQKLVGATDRFVKAPFLLEGLLQGLLGAGLALGGLAAFERLVAPRLASLFGFLAHASSAVALVDAGGALQLVGLGAALGLVGSAVAVGRFLDV